MRDATATVGEVDEPPSWNIFAQSGVRSGNSQWGNIFEPLVDYDYANRSFVGVLATKWEMNGRTWTFHLREGVTFSDGTPLTAGDVVFTFDRIKNHPESLQASNMSQVESMRAVNDLTVEVTLKEVLVSFLSNVQNRYIVSKAVFGANSEQDAMRKMIGTGPYTLTSWQQGADMTMARNEKYWGEKPTVKTLILRPILDDGARIAALKAGEIDLMRELPIQDVKQIENTPGVKMIKNEGTRMLMLPFNPTFQPFGDVRVRQAVSLAIDVKSIVENVLSGTMKPMAGPLPSTIAGFNPGWPQHEYNPDKAKGLVQEIGGGAPVDITFTAPNGSYPLDREMMQVIAQQLTAAGFKVKVDSPDFATISANLDDGKLAFYMISKGNYVDAGAVLQQYFQTGITKRTMYDNPQVNTLLRSQANETDEAKRNQLLTQAADLIRNDYAAVWLGTYDNLWAASNTIRWSPDPSEHILGKDITVTG